MNSFHGTGKRCSYFEGWYFKQQNSEDTVALIPAFHVDASRQASASLQVITNEESCYVHFPEQAFRASRKRLLLHLGDCVFSSNGCELNINGRDCTLHGGLRFGEFTPPAYDIMGPFRFVPFMQCRHSVFSLYHRVDGWLTVNGKNISIRNGSGYLEGDRGTSFPSRYVWTQCAWDGNCIMLSVADIPFGRGSFTGCIGCVFINGKEHRIATYLGVRLTQVSGNGVCLRQGKLTLNTELLEAGAHSLRAPEFGGMTRMIHESPACRVKYTCTLGREVLLDFISEQASYESNWSEDLS